MAHPDWQRTDNRRVPTWYRRLHSRIAYVSEQDNGSGLLDIVGEVWENNELRIRMTNSLGGNSVHRMMGRLDNCLEQPGALFIGGSKPKAKYEPGTPQTRAQTRYDPTAIPSHPGYEPDRHGDGSTRDEASDPPSRDSDNPATTG